MENLNTMNVAEIMKKTSKSNLAHVKFTREELNDTVNYYKSLSVIFLDTEDNVTFL